MSNVTELFESGFAAGVIIQKKEMREQLRLHEEVIKAADYLARTVQADRYPLDALHKYQTSRAKLEKKYLIIPDDEQTFNAIMEAKNSGDAMTKTHGDVVKNILAALRGQERR